MQNIEDDPGNISDGYHTFHELYQHRHLLFLHMVKHDRLAWKSKSHPDGSMYKGWFVVGTTLLCHKPGTDYAEFKPISYHLPLDMWDLCDAKVLMHAPPFDGHTSYDVLDRLREAL